MTGSLSSNATIKIMVFGITSEDRMDLLERNPFTTIKANDLDDSEINEQWVDNPKGGFLDIFCPTHKISQYIIGGKGSGKTHLMRYFSHNSQRIRNKNSILEGIERDGYFGVYFQASGLNGERFENLPFQEEKKYAIFQYSYELWCAGLLIQSLLDINKDELVFEYQYKFCADVLSLLSGDTDQFKNVRTLEDLKTLILDLSKEVDYAVSNAFFSENVEVNILASRGSLIFGIPKLISDHCHYFKKVTFLYIIDELENISYSQQVYINTLLREKKLPCSFRIGARGYGIKTYKTLGSGEENREGHEYEIIRLDDLFSDSVDYESFATNLILNRLKKSKLISGKSSHLNIIESDIEIKKAFLKSFFENPDYSEITEIKHTIEEEPSKKIKQLRSSIELSKIPNEDIDKIIENLSFNQSEIIESALIHLFSQYWFKNKVSVSDLIDESERLNSEAKVLLSENIEHSPTFNKKISYYKNNYIAKTLRIKNHNNLEQYLGLDNLFVATTGFPRHILTVLRNIYKTEVFEGRTPFTGDSLISTRSQRIALLDASNWFYSECGNEGKLGNKVSYFLHNICELLRIEMYADKPVECSASSFTIDTTKLSNEAKEVLTWAELTGGLVRGQDRQDKNSQALIDKYHINSLLCPKWGLPLSRRGALSFSASDFECFIDINRNKEYEEFVTKFEQSRNIPFGIEEESMQLGLDF